MEDRGGLIARSADAWPDLADLSPLAAFVDRTGPLAVVDLKASGSADSRSSELLEIGIALVDGADLRLFEALVRPKRELGPSVTRLTGLSAEAFAGAPPIEALAPELAEALAGRTLVAHEAAPARHFLSRAVAPALARADFLDTEELLSLTHPDAGGLRFRDFVAHVLGTQAKGRALADALDVLRLMLAVAEGAAFEEPRYREARRALDRFVPESAWLPLLGKGLHVEAEEDAPQFIDIEASSEAPVPFEVDAIAAALADVERGRRHFKHYHSRPEQIELMRGFYRTLSEGGTLLLEGGTGVGKSLAYLAAAIPFAMERARMGERGPIIISTRTKLLQDQLLEKDIAAAARMLGYPELRALSIKGRANYVCEKRLQETLDEGRDPSLLVDDRLAWALLMTCARNRPAGEVGSLPRTLRLRHPLLGELAGRAVARRAEQCSREECGKRKACPFGQRRGALGKAHLVVANHDLLLRWPPDYPRFTHVIADEGHELADVADDVYALVVRPEELMIRIDEIFGAPPTGLAGGEPGRGMLPRKQRLEGQKEASALKRALHLDLSSIGRGIAGRASEYGEVQLPERADRHFPQVAKIAEAAAQRLDAIARLAESLDARAEWTFDEAPTGPADGPSPLQKNADALREAAVGLRTAFSESSGDVVAGFDRLITPYDRWTLAIRSVSPAADFHDRFLEGLDAFAAVSASLFIAGDAFAALGELEIEERAAFDVDRVALASPFDYANHMRVVALQTPPGELDLVGETARVIALLARALGGRTLGLFTSLKRMNDVADLLAADLAGESIEVLAPRRAADDPAGLVDRFRSLPGGGVLLGARTFWQGLDIAGDDLQAVVIEKLPFEVPTELRRRREARIQESGVNAFERYRLGKMLLYLKQMTGRLIRGEDDRGIVVIVESRSDKRYFRDLDKAFPPGVEIRLARREELPAILSELEISATFSAP